MALRTLSLCSGAGMLERGVELAGCTLRTVLYVEREAFAGANLAAAMEAGALAPAPIWSDLERLPCHLMAGDVDLVTAGFPCQPWSGAGHQRGTEDERWIWPDIVRVVREVGPRLVFLENVPGLITGGGLAIVLGDLAELGFDAEWVCVRASDAGAPHKRNRVFILAYRRGEREGEPYAQGGGIGRDGPSREAPLGSGNEPVAHRDGGGRTIERGGRVLDGIGSSQWGDPDGCDAPLESPTGADVEGRQPLRGEGGGSSQAWPPGPQDAEGWRRYEGPQPCIRRDADGVADRVDRLRLCGNGVVPQQAALAFRILAERAGLT